MLTQEANLMSKPICRDAGSTPCMPAARLFARRMGWHEMARFRPPLLSNMKGWHEMARFRPPFLPNMKKNADGSVTPMAA